MLALLGLQLAVEPPLGRGRRRTARPVSRKNWPRPLLEVDGEAQQRDAVGVLRGLDAREDGELRRREARRDRRSGASTW